MEATEKRPGEENIMTGNRILILGSGYLGEKLGCSLKDSIISKRRINSQKDVEEEIDKHKADVVINCIGKTGRPNIDWCEDHKEETFFSNVLVPCYIALACKKRGKKMVQIGSGCAYEGDNNGRGFTEEDEPNYYGSFYSRTKIHSENLLKEFENVLQLRIRMPISFDKSKRNLLNKLLSYDRIISIENSISVVEDFARITEELIKRDERGIFNVVNQGSITHEEILNLAGEISGEKMTYDIISEEELGRMTKTGRSNCILSVEKLRSKGIEVPGIKESVRKTIEKYFSVSGQELT